MSRSTKRAYPKLCHEKRRKKKNPGTNWLIIYSTTLKGPTERAEGLCPRSSYESRLNQKKKKMGKNISLLHINFLVKRNIYRRLSKFLRLQPTKEKFAFKCFLQEVAIEVVESRDSVQERKNS